MNLDLYSRLLYAKGGVATLSGTTPFESNIVDCSAGESLVFVLQTGTVTDAGTASGFTMKLQESDDTADANFTDVAAADVISADDTNALTVTDDTDDDVCVGAIGYRGVKRYVRAVVTGTTGTNAVVAVQAVVGDLHHAAPATAVAADIAAT